MDDIRAFPLEERFHSAVAFEQAGQPDAAANLYQSILENFPDHRDSLINLGALHFKNGRYQPALECYLKAVKLFEDSATLFNIGSIYYKAGEYKKSILFLEKARKYNHQFYLVSLVMGLCFSRLKNYRAAFTHFTDVLTHEPTNKIALTALSILNFNDGRYDQALACINTLLENDPANIRMLELKTAVLYKSGKITESAEGIKTIAKISDGYRFYNEYIKSVPVKIYTDRYGTIDEKIRILETKSINDRNSLISLSLCHLLKGDTDAAIDRLLEAKKRAADQ